MGTSVRKGDCVVYKNRHLINSFCYHNYLYLYVWPSMSSFCLLLFSQLSFSSGFLSFSMNPNTDLWNSFVPFTEY